MIENDFESRERGRVDFNRSFEYENAFYMTSTVERISKFATHLELFRRTSALPGEIVECGVFRGSSLYRFVKFRSLFENSFTRRIIAFDTFGEFPIANYQPDERFRDSFIQVAGSCSISKDDFIASLEKISLYHNLDLIQGDITETVPHFKAQNPQLKISLLHVDVDLYEATRVCLEQFYPSMVKGGIVILDDYGVFPGANKAVDEFFLDHKMKIQRLPYSHSISFIEIE